MMLESPIFDMSDVYERRSVKVSRRITEKGHIIQMHDHNGNKSCGMIYENETLSSLYDKCYNTFNNISPICEKLSTKRILYEKDIILTNRKNIDKYNYCDHSDGKKKIYDVFLCNEKGGLLSIPCDETKLFGDFKRENQSYFVPSNKIPVLTMYNIYVVTDETVMFLKNRAIEEDQKYSISANITKIRKYFTCAAK
jgi:hypothetical protein